MKLVVSVIQVELQLNVSVIQVDSKMDCGLGAGALAGPGRARGFFVRHRKTK